MLEFLHMTVRDLGVDGLDMGGVGGQLHTLVVVEGNDVAIDWVAFLQRLARDPVHRQTARCIIGVTHFYIGGRLWILCTWSGGDVEC